MKNIKSFDDLFPRNHKRYMGFLETMTLSQIDKEINDIIEESYGISENVIEIVDVLTNFICGEIENGEYTKIEPFDLNCNLPIVPDFYCISGIFTIDGFIFDVDCSIMNYENISNDDFDMISTLNIEAQTQAISNNRFKIYCSIPSKDFDISVIGKRILNHEIMHAWQHHNKNINGKKEREHPEWNRLYRTSISTLKRDNDNLIAKAIYYSDLRELASFTQQAYQEIKDIVNTNDFHRQMRELDIYKGVNSIKSAIEFLETNELPDDFSIIKKSVLIKILKKRYYQYKKNIARLIMARKETINEYRICFDSTPLDWLYINRF